MAGKKTAKAAPVAAQAGEVITVAKPFGRPTKYRPEYCEDIIEYFSIPPYRESTDNSGRPIFIPNAFPTLAGFAALKDVNKDTLHEWCRNYPDFSDAFKKAKELQEANLVQGTMSGAYQQTFAIFCAKNVLGWRDSKDLTIGGDQDKPLLTRQIVIEGVSTRV